MLKILNQKKLITNLENLHGFSKKDINDIINNFNSEKISNPGNYAQHKFCPKLLKDIKKINKKIISIIEVKSIEKNFLSYYVYYKKNLKINICKFSVLFFDNNEFVIMRINKKDYNYKDIKEINHFLENYFIENNNLRIVNLLKKTTFK